MKFQLLIPERKGITNHLVAFLVISLINYSYFTSYHRNSLAEDKRRLEGRLSTLEEDLEEEQLNYESAVEKARKAREQHDQLEAETSQYQANIFKLETSKSQLEKQVMFG